MLIKHKMGGLRLPKYDLFFPKGEAIEVSDAKLAERILRNPEFEEVKEKKGGKG